jgi:hypothetical protein
MAAASRRLVIDASVASAASSKQHPVSIACRDALAAVLNTCHRMVMTNDIAEEWGRHQSGFSLRWRRSMNAKKKIIRVAVARNDALRARLAEIELDRQTRENILKDFHLVEAALATDQAILSLDRSARIGFKQAAKGVGLLRPLVWLVPSSPEHKTVEWLEQGAVLETKRTLCSEE